MKICQYTCGRGKAEGYNSSASSEGAALLVDEWMRKMRASAVENELPTREIQSSTDEKGELTKLVLCSSCHVQYDYALRDGKIQKVARDTYDYSHYLILGSGDDSAGELKTVQTGLKMLLHEELFLTPYHFQQAIEIGQLPDLEENIDDIETEWNEAIKEPRGNTLTGKRMGAFLARYWEACWNRKRKKGQLQPLIVICTSPKRNRETNAKAVLRDGVIFFHEDVLPCLPPAVRKMISVSIGCIGQASNAQEGTACMVCYPTDDTLSMHQVYRVYEDQLNDNGLDTNYLLIGEAMRENRMPESYKILSGFKHYELAEQDFDWIYSLAEYEEMLADLEKPLDSQEKHLLFLDCYSGLSTLANMLLSDGVDSADVWLVLRPLEKRLADLSFQFTSAYSGELYKEWVSLYDSLPARYPKGDDAIEKSWENVLVKAYPNMEWNEDIPIILLSNHALDSRWKKLLTKALKNGQTVSRALDESDQTIFTDLIEILLQFHREGPHDLAKCMMEFLSLHCLRNEALLSPVSFLSSLKNQSVTPSNRDDIIEELQYLCNRHLEIIQDNDFSGLDDVLNELLFQEKIIDQAKLYPLYMTDKELTILLRGAEEFLLEWQCRHEFVFQEQLYAALLDRAISLPSRGDELMEDEFARLSDRYDLCITGQYLRCSLNQHPLAVILKKDWSQTRHWECTIAQNALAGEVFPCDVNQIVDRLILLRKQNEHETADVYVQLLCSQTEYISDALDYYLSETEDLSVSETDFAQWLAPDAIRILDANKNQNASFWENRIQPLSNWYRSLHCERNEELVEKIEHVFSLLLDEAKKKGQDYFKLIVLYCETFDWNIQLDTEFILSIFKPLEGKKLAELVQDTASLNAVKTLCSHIPSKQKNAVRILRQSIENSKNGRLDPKDIKWVVLFADSTGLDSCNDEIFEILAGLGEAPLSEEIIAVLCQYTKDHPDFQDDLAKFCMNRARNADSSARTTHVCEALQLLHQSNMRGSTKEENFRILVEGILEHPDNFSLRQDVIDSLILVAEEVCRLNPQKTKLLVVRLFEYMGNDISSAQMDKAAEKLNITLVFCTVETPRWNSFFLNKTVKTIKSDLLSARPSLNTMLDIAKTDQDIQNINRLYEMVSDSNMLAYVERSISETCRSMNESDPLFRSTEQLIPIIQKLITIRESGDNAFFIRCVLKEALEHIGNIFREDERFSSLVKDVQAFPSLRRCLEALKVDEHPELRDKYDAICSASHIMALYEKNTSGQEIHALLTETNLAGWKYVDAVITEYGRSKAATEGIEMTFVPVLMSTLAANKGNHNIPWDGFLNAVFPLEEKGGWLKTDIWKSSENVYGKLAAIMNWLSKEGMEAEHDSFVKFLNASNIGKKARTPSRLKSIRKHVNLDEISDNAMMRWLLKGDSRR